MAFFRVNPPVFILEVPPPGLHGNPKSGALFYHCTTRRCYTIWGVAWGTTKTIEPWGSLAEY